MPGHFQICQISGFWHINMPPGKSVKKQVMLCLHSAEVQKKLDLPSK